MSVVQEQDADPGAEQATFVKELVHRLDLGVVVIDKEYRVQLWNRFMVLHSGITPEEIEGQLLFDHFPEIPVKWFKKKIESVFILNTNAFVTWEQRQFIFKFRHNRPITGGTEFMAQNITIMPIGEGKKVSHAAISIFDVTDVYVFRTQLQEANKKLEELSRTDGLTGIFNRAHLEEMLMHEYGRSLRYEQPLALIMLDIDHFKRVNDTKGHLAGDAVIRGIANAVNDNIRGHDVLGRYGGEEFCIFLPATSLEGAMVCAEKVRKIIEESVIMYNEEQIKVTSSFGVSVITPSIHSYEKLIDAADAALYISKNKGRNAVSTMFELEGNTDEIPAPIAEPPSDEKSSEGEEKPSEDKE